ncbi:hypothetical protein BDR03DRAFT_976086 [Suillus americanus]|nr:hypothetical protein BDR03DRAFT_976086 [Suillus americanus]
MFAVAHCPYDSRLYFVRPTRKKRWGWLKKCRSVPHLARPERVARASQSNLSSPSSSRTESRGRSSGLIRELWGRIFKSRSACSARRTVNTVPAAISVSAPDIPHPQTSQDPSPLTTLR